MGYGLVQLLPHTAGMVMEIWLSKLPCKYSWDSDGFIV